MTHRAEPPGRPELTGRPKASLNIGQTRAGRVVMEAGSHYEAKAHLTSRPTAQGLTHPSPKAMCSALKRSCLAVSGIVIWSNRQETKEITITMSCRST